MPTLTKERDLERGEVDARAVPEYSVHLDAVRGAAALLVFLVHARMFFLQSLLNHHRAVSASTLGPVASSSVHLSRTVRSDYAHQAVMVFFVLSGYLVGGSVLRSIHRNDWSWKRYLVHRTVRLWMVLVPALILGLVFDLAGSHHFAGEGTIYSGPPGQDLIPPGLSNRLSPGTLLGNLFFLQTIRVTPLGTNQPLWSLANEFWYYLACPCLMLSLLAPWSWWKRMLAIAGMGAILLFAGQEIAWYFSIWLLGALAAWLPLKIPARQQRAFVFAALTIFLAGNLLVSYDHPNHFPVDFFLGILFSILIYGLAHLRLPARNGIYRRSARFMSKISYSLYLTHGPVFCLMSAILVGSWRLLPMGGHAVAVLAEALTVAFLIACTVHFLFESRTDRVRSYLEARLR
ncbi:O-antigen acetylase [Acidisarcina polymorpha]|uniref:O-antigen acetylase n=1 Tax=Acidisarcina polymorpha TaxID=2211140 RepID=A0A2Z5FYA5_9BACT|nr:acyltransferase [Acidisarcina polymorpha]AXC11792.1 O-antigen acetylase [Acidisarcina polymorpha]